MTTEARIHGTLVRIEAAIDSAILRADEARGKARAFKELITITCCVAAAGVWAIFAVLALK